MVATYQIDLETHSGTIKIRRGVLDVENGIPVSSCSLIETAIVFTGPPEDFGTMCSGSWATHYAHFLNLAELFFWHVRACQGEACVQVHGEATRWWEYGALPHAWVRLIGAESLRCRLLSWHTRCLKRFWSQGLVLVIQCGTSSSTPTPTLARHRQIMSVPGGYRRQTVVVGRWQW